MTSLFAHVGGKNLADGQPTSSSSVIGDLRPDLAVDSNDSPDSRQESCFFSGFEDHPWWSVDLGRKVQVRNVVVTTRNKSGRTWVTCQIRKIAGPACTGNAGNFYPHRDLAIPPCIMARAWRTCGDACRDTELAVSIEVGGGENDPCIPGACASHNLTYLARGLWCKHLTYRLPQS